MRHLESRLQQSCVRWFDYQHYDYKEILFAIPNGGARSGIEAAIMKGEGVRAGVADMILLLARDGFSSLCIEFKVGKGRQSLAQQTWQIAAESVGNKYCIVRSFEEFKKEIESYIGI